MREIKFRAWLNPRWEDDDDANRMYYDIQDSYDNLGNVKPYDPMTSFASWFNDEVAIVEQYTGLKDKNGREIYEGDIVRATYFEAHYRALKVGKKRKITGKIIYGSACFFIESISDETPLLQVGGSENIEVIGNIHENPELFGDEDE